MPRNCEDKYSIISSELTAKISIMSPELHGTSQETIGKWTFWHITGVQDILHAYLRTEMLPNLGEIPGQKIARKCQLTTG